MGRWWDARRDLLATFRTLHDTHGDVVWSRVGGLRVLLAFGPDAASVVFRNADDAFSNRLGWRLFLDHVFPGALLGMDGDGHRQQRRIMQVAFTTPSLRRYVTQMVPALRASIDAWRPGESAEGAPFLAYPALKSLTLDVATSTFLGVEPDASADAINRAFIDTVEASIAVVRVPGLPTTYGRGRRGRALLERHFRALLADKRAAPGDDLLSRIALAESEEGARFSDEEIVDHIIFVMMAAHDTSTSTLATTLYALARHPEFQEALRAQALERDDILDYDALLELSDLRDVVSEALRMHPPVPAMPRVTRAPVTLGGYLVPAGTLVIVPVLHTHHDPRWWTSPEQFSPERFSAERGEHRAHRHVWSPFGGGAHRCIGERFGMLEILAALHLMLRRYRWSVPEAYRLPYQHVPIARPKDGLPLHLQPL